MLTAVGHGSSCDMPSVVRPVTTAGIGESVVSTGEQESSEGSGEKAYSFRDGVRRY